MYKLVLVPHKILYKKAKPVKIIDGSVRAIIKSMEATLNVQKDPMGVGLAAPQVGLDLAIFLMKPTPKSPVMAVINPKILETVYEPSENQQNEEEDEETQLEGCLSIPKIWAPVKRAQKIHLEYQNIEGQKVDAWFEDFDAVIIQHEVDHLNGVLFTQRAVEQDSTIYEEKGGKLVPREI